MHTDDNPTHLLTKGLASERFAHCRALKVRDINDNATYFLDELDGI